MSYTDFSKYSHAELRRMVQTLNPGEVMAAADPWRRAADTLKAIRTTLTRASTEAATSWEGSTSDAFHSRMLHLATTINTAASYANDAAITLKAISEAIDKAKADMPEEPSGFAQLKDAVGDTFSSLFGADDEDAHTDLVNQKKTEAATVLQTLAMHYRTATPMLKPPQPPGPPKNDWKDSDSTDLPADGTGESGYAAVGGFLGGVGVGNASTGTAPVSRPREGAVADPRAGGAGRSNPQGPSPSFSKAPSTPSDPGVKGGVAMPQPKATPVSFGTGTVVDGAAVVSAPSASGGQSPSGGTGTSILGSQGNGGGQSLSHSPLLQPAAPQGSQGGGTPHPSGIPQPFGSVGGQAPGSGAGWNGQARPEAVRGDRSGLPGRTGAGRSGAIFGAEGVPGVSGGGTAGGGSGRGMGAAEAAAGGTVVGVGDRSGKSNGGKQAFTEGGSGLGARGRIRPEAGSGSPLAQPPMVPLGSADRGKRDDEKRKGRPDYLVEDEETWASDDPVNPNVVE
ncbi:PPE domain-containing protein [Kitasatospora sp. NPDC056184]|uniref:PPE domain-containing protein n=1 Tax=Kitasatospora sp. NPDC056184 TaxID=3345738 RepID=UPI0035D6AF5C